jgi:hypothetical protein
MLGGEWHAAGILVSEVPQGNVAIASEINHLEFNQMLNAGCSETVETKPLAELLAKRGLELTHHVLDFGFHFKQK